MIRPVPEIRNTLAHQPEAPARVSNNSSLALRVSVLVPFLLAGCTTAAQDHLRQVNEAGIAQFRQGDYQGACQSFSTALQLEPGDTNLLYNIGQCNDRLGDAAAAEKCYRQCLVTSEHHAECWHALMTLMYRTGRQAEATRMIQDWLARAPDRADAYAEDGWRLRQDKAYPQAQGRLQQALAIDPHNVRALTELGILYEQTQMPERALVLYERALIQKPNQPEIVDRLNELRHKNVGRPLPDS